MPYPLPASLYPYSSRIQSLQYCYNEKQGMENTFYPVSHALFPFLVLILSFHKGNSLYLWQNDFYNNRDDFSHDGASFV